MPENICQFHAENLNRSGIDVGVPDGFPPNLVCTLIFGIFFMMFQTKTMNSDDFKADVPY